MRAKMKTKMKNAIASLSLAVPALFSAPALAQASYPVRPIRIIVPIAPGGGADITARALAQKLIGLWGQQIIIDNRAGAGGT